MAPSRDLTDITAAIAESVQQDMMIAMLGELQGASAACTRVCLQRLRDLHAEMLNAMDEELQARRGCGQGAEAAARHMGEALRRLKRASPPRRKAQVFAVYDTEDPDESFSSSAYPKGSELDESFSGRSSPVKGLEEQGADVDLEEMYSNLNSLDVRGPRERAAGELPRKGHRGRGQANAQLHLAAEEAEEDAGVVAGQAELRASRWSGEAHGELPPAGLAPERGPRQRSGRDGPRALPRSSEEEEELQMDGDKQLAGGQSQRLQGECLAAQLDVARPEGPENRQRAASDQLAEEAVHKMDGQRMVVHEVADQRKEVQDSAEEAHAEEQPWTQEDQTVLHQAVAMDLFKDCEDDLSEIQEEDEEDSLWKRVDLEEGDLELEDQPRLEESRLEELKEELKLQARAKPEQGDWQGRSWPGDLGSSVSTVSMAESEKDGSRSLHSPSWHGSAPSTPADPATASLDGLELASLAAAPETVEPDMVEPEAAALAVAAAEAGAEGPPPKAASADDVKAEAPQAAARAALRAVPQAAAQAQVRVSAIRRQPRPESVASSSTSTALAEQRPEEAARRRPKTEMQNLWKVIGGSSNGGIKVRDGPDIDSPENTERLETGSLINALEYCKANGNSRSRIRYRLLTGRGPKEGWISLRWRGKELLREMRVEEAKKGPKKGRKSSVGAGTALEDKVLPIEDGKAPSQAAGERSAGLVARVPYRVQTWTCDECDQESPVGCSTCEFCGGIKGEGAVGNLWSGHDRSKWGIKDAHQRSQFLREQRPTDP